MNELIKSVLSVRAGFSPNNGSCLISYWCPITRNGLPIAFHISLLKISCKTVKVLIVRKNSFRSCTKKIVIPDTNEGQDYRNIFFERFIFKMHIHGVGTFQKFLEIFKSNRTRNR